MKVGSLFSGIGGIDSAFQQLGFDIVFANEIDKDACKTYRHNYPDVNLFEQDIRNLSVNELPDADIIAAGFPCQPFSVCGKQKGFSDDRGNLFFEIMKIVDAKKPKIIFLENVANLVEHDNGHTFNVIHNELASRNYYLRYIVADACDYGVPQHRTRTYLLAFDDESDCLCFHFPQKRTLSNHIFDLIDKNIRVPKEFYLEETSWQYQRMLEAITDANQIYRFSDFGIQSSKDSICFTLKANMGVWNNRIPIIKDNFGIRLITPNECLALQGFQKEFCFPDIPLRSAYKQCGNTVVVCLVREIISGLLNLL